ncbi:vacuolar protein sorting-associated protein 52 homolog isoform X1 [Daphnia pulicaria]|uniref:vacuolar protein sorting-associated protein 52 homolog isoform X1 n=1 Tax=Daphnia pulicaria TaxID=35523 RepID=UPI001EEA7D65|nr:vacuolar protein sorting-associated protein 52 homolog isoform X1 [Daphnia pulicaria]
MEDHCDSQIKMDLKVSLKDSIIKEALNSGVDLRQYSQQVEQQLQEVELVSVQDYVNQGTSLAQLHSQFTQCDVALERMEGLLSTFRSQLGGLSSDILQLQHQSAQLGLRLSNRQAARSLAGQIIDDLVIPEALIRHLLETPVTEPSFSEQLIILQAKLALSGDHHQRCSRAAQDVVPVLGALRIKVVERLRQFLLLKLQQLRRPLANYQLPQNSLLKHKNFYHFLITQEPEIAYEVRQDYVQTMSKLYFSYFKSYSTRLLKLVDSNSVNKDDVLASEDASLGAAAAAAARSLFGRAAPSGRSSSSKSTVFTLGTRIEVVTNLEAPVLVPHAAATGTSAGHKGETKYSYEIVFRSQHYALADNACREYLFLCEFFHVERAPAMELFQEVMGKTCTIYMKFVEEYVSSCYDSLALFLCIQMVQRLQYLCHKRAVPALDFYYESLVSTLWPRFEYLVQANIQSVRDCDPSRLYSNIDTRPHYVVRRYAEYTSAISAIHEHNSITSAMDWTPRLHHLLSTMQEEVEGFTLRLAAAFTKRKDQLVALINNYDLMLSVMTERNREESREAARCKELLSARISEFVEEILFFHFEGLVRFVKDCEVMLTRGLNEALRNEERRATQTINAFMAGWKKSLDEINKEILNLFPNFKNGTNILQATLTQLVEYYHRFQKILTQHPFRNVPARADLINIHQLMVEVRRYKPAF